MSYILEALRRSQAERERGRVPGLDAQLAPAEPAHGAGRALPLTWVASGLGLLLFVAAMAFARWWTQQAPSPRLPQSGPAVAAPAPAPAPAQAATTATAPLRAPETAAATPRLPQVVSAPPPLPAAPPAAVAPPAPPPPRTLTLAQLSADQRRELPAMVIGGSIWSDSAASRFVIINGQVVREGEAAADGVILERVGPKSAMLRWRDLKIELPL